MADLYTQADLYCAAFDWPLDGEVDWLLDRLPGAGSVLEPMCGNARYGPVFADRGLRYHGFDLSAEMLARVPGSPRVSATVGDARSFSIPGDPFDLVWCPINSIRHLTDDDDLLAHLRCVRDHLAHDGVYVVESDLMRHDGPWGRGPDDKSVWTQPQPDGSVVRATWSIDRCDLARRLVWERAHIERLVDDAVVEHVEHVYEMRMVTTEDWPRLAAAGGFTIDHVHRNQPSKDRPAVTLSPALENDGLNYFLFLKPEPPA